MHAAEVDPSHLAVVTDDLGRGAALKGRVERIGMPIEELAQRVGMTREQVGKILGGKVPNSRSFGRIERVLDEIDAEHGRAPSYTATASVETQIEIEAEGVFGINRIVVRGVADEAEESFARLIERLRRGDDPGV